MIIQKVRGKNFLSIGNAFIEFDVLKYKRTILGGANGSAKSALSNLITFGLFGQAIKNISKPQIVNSVNGKGTIVEIEFNSNNKEYLVRRGIKPNIFEIYENGNALDQSTTPDFQKYLEKNIIKTNFKTFLQTTILSVENYKPFMSLRTFERRAFVEEILDIKVFSYMNQIIKSKYSKNVDELKVLDLQIKNLFAKAKLQKSHIEHIETIKNSNVNVTKIKIDDLNKEKSEILAKNKEHALTLKENSEKLAELNKKSKEHQKILSKLDSYETQIVGMVDKIDSVHGSSCPLCAAEIDHDTKSNIINPLKETIDDLNNKKRQLLVHLETYENVGTEIIEVTELLSDLNSKVSINNGIISSINKNISTLEEELQLSSQTEELANLKADLKSTATEAIELKNKQATLQEEQQYNDMMIELFKDTGVKSKIVDQYIPIINGLIAEYLKRLNFFVSFTLDSEFNESIKSRYRDDFTYGSFSAGERARLDLAILFTFRQLSKIRNAFECNLLFLDEILEFLDQAGIDDFIAMINEMEDFEKTNIIVISHKSRDQLVEVFDGSILMYKDANFSKMLDLSK